jgi:hypothetical protein
MDRTSTSNPLFDEQDDTSDYVNKAHLFGVQRALHQENEALGDCIEQLATNLRNSEARTPDYLDTKLSTQMEEFRAMMVNRASSTSSSLQTHLPTQVSHDLVLIFETIVKIIKLHKTHSMVMVCKTAFVSANDIIAKNKMTKSKNDNVNAKKSKTVTPSVKNNNIVKNKSLKHNEPYEKQLAPSKSAIEECVRKKKHSNKSNKMKPLVLRSAKKGGVGQESVALHAKLIMRSKRLKTPSKTRPTSPSQPS